MILWLDRQQLGSPLAMGLGWKVSLRRWLRFSREQSLILWVALRVAFLELLAPPPEALEQVMGLEWLPDAQGEDRMRLAQHWRTTLSEDQQSKVFGLACSILMRVADFGRYAEMNVADLSTDPLCWMPEALAVDCIVWSAVALLRLGIAQPLFTKVPEPDELSKPDWYTEPLFAKAERFWDGSDWTARCRIKDGYQFIEASAPLRKR